MSFLGRALAARAQRSADPVSLEEFGYLLGQRNGSQVKTRAGVTMSPKRALGLTAWYSGVRYLSESVASLPVHTYQDRKARSRRSDPQWMVKPDQESVWFGLVELWMMSLLHRGGGFAFKLRNGIEQVTGLRGIHPDRVTVAQAPDGTKRFRVDHVEHEFTTREILHIPGLSYDGVVGLNPLHVQAESLGTVAAADEYAGRFFGQGTHIGGVISVPQELDKAAAQRMKDEWDRFHQGLREAHQTGVLSKGATYEKLGLNAADTQLIETRQYGVAEVARILRIPPHKLYELSRSTFSNIEHQSIEAVMDSIRPWVVRLEAWINADPDLLPPSNFVEFQVEGMLRGDTLTRYQSYTMAINGGWMSRAEPRRLENRVEVEGLDEFLVPLNMRPASDPVSLKERVDSAAALVRAGFNPDGSLTAVGMAPIPHSGRLPVTVQAIEEEA